MVSVPDALLLANSWLLSVYVSVNVYVPTGNPPGIANITIVWPADTVPVPVANWLPLFSNVTVTEPLFTVEVLLTPTVMDTVWLAVLKVAVPLPADTVTGAGVGELVTVNDSVFVAAA